MQVLQFFLMRDDTRKLARSSVGAFAKSGQTPVLTRFSGDFRPGSRTNAGVSFFVLFCPVLE
jgi:hypothetical protein